MCHPASLCNVMSRNIFFWSFALNVDDSKKINWFQIISYVTVLIMSHVFISKYLSCLERRQITSNDVIAGNGKESFKGNSI